MLHRRGRGRCAGRLRLISSIIGVDWIEEPKPLYNFETRNASSSLRNKFATRHEAIGERGEEIDPRLRGGLTVDVQTGLYRDLIIPAVRR